MATCVLALLILTASALQAGVSGCKEPPGKHKSPDCGACVQAVRSSNPRPAERRSLYEHGVGLAKDILKWLTQPSGANPGDTGVERPVPTHLTPYAWSTLGPVSESKGCSKNRN